MAQWVWPGEFTGTKFSLYSADKVLISRLITIKHLGLDTQKTLGTQNNTKTALTQLALKLIQFTLGSKIENKLFMLFNKKNFYSG